MYSPMDNKEIIKQLIEDDKEFIVFLFMFGGLVLSSLIVLIYFIVKAVI